jgi:hypothetical protein
LLPITLVGVTVFAVLLAAVTTLMPMDSKYREIVRLGGLFVIRCLFHVPVTGAAWLTKLFLWGAGTLMYLWNAAFGIDPDKPANEPEARR